MKRDMELIRNILLAIEKGGADTLEIEGYSLDILKYHKQLIIEADLAKGSVLPDKTGSNSGVPYDVHIARLTNSGHDLLDAIKTETSWNKVKEFVVRAGKEITIDSIKAAAASLSSLY